MYGDYQTRGEGLLSPDSGVIRRFTAVYVDSWLACPCPAHAPWLRDRVQPYVQQAPSLPLPTVGAQGVVA